MWDWPVAVMGMTGTLACEMVVRYREDSGKKPRIEHLNVTTPWKDGEFITIPDDLRPIAAPTLNRNA